MREESKSRSKKGGVGKGGVGKGGVKGGAGGEGGEGAGNPTERKDRVHSPTCLFRKETIFSKETDNKLVSLIFSIGQLSIL